MLEYFFSYFHTKYLELILHSQSICDKLIAFFNSKFFNSIAIVVAAALTALIAFRTFYSQQRTKRLQKIYLEDFLLKTQDYINDGIGIMRMNMKLFESAINLIINCINQTYVDQDTLIKRLKEINTLMKIPEMQDYSQNEMVIELFKEKGYLFSQWLGKFEEDVQTFCYLMIHQLHIIVNHLLYTTQKNKEKGIEFLNDIAKYVEAQNGLLLRHSVLSYLVHNLLNKLVVIDFKTKKSILKFCQDNTNVIVILNNINESFKILFGFYEVNDKLFYSYAKNEDGNNFKIEIINDETVCISAEKINNDFKSRLFIVTDESILAGIKINGSDVIFMKALIGIANLNNFNEKPRFLDRKKNFSK